MLPSTLNLDSVRNFLLEKEQARQRILDERFNQICHECSRIIMHIARNHRVHRIYQWGSLLDRSRFSEISDVDIALEGVKDYQEFSLILGEAEKMTDFPLDLVEMEHVGKENAQYIRETGRLVYEQK